MDRTLRTPHSQASHLPTWLHSASVTWACALMSLLVIVLAAGFLLIQEQAVEANELQSTELYARVLQDHAERTFNTIDIAISALAENLEAGLRTNDSRHLNEDLGRALSGLPFLRSLSLIDHEGLVVASSSASNIGVVLDPSIVALPAPGIAERFGTSTPGRDLVDAQREHDSAASAGGRSFVPLVRALENSASHGLYIAAVLNTDFFGNEYELTLADTTRSAGMFAIDATMLAATSNLAQMPGQRLRAHRFFTDFLPTRESGSYVGPGIDGNKVVTAFRLLRKRPLVIVVERSYEHLLERFHSTLLWTLAGGAMALLLVLAMGVMAWRSLKGHEAVTETLENTRLTIATSERDLRVLVESVHELVFRADAHGRIVFVNGRWHDLTRQSPDQVLGKRLTDICREAERESCQALFSEAVNRGTLLMHVRDAQGKELTLDLSVSRVVQADGSTEGYAGFAVDVSERESARQALQAQLRFTAQLLEVNPTPMFVKDEHARFTMVNQAWLALMQLTRPEVLGRKSQELFGYHTRRHMTGDSLLPTSEAMINYESRLAVEGRPPRDIVISKVRFTRADGAQAGIVGSIVDVTEFRDAERSSREARDAAQLANSAKSEFISNISHELRTPLQGIIGFSEVGRDLAGDRPDFVDMFADIHAGGMRMLTLVNGLLDVAQMDSTVGSLPLRRTDVAELVHEAVGQMQPKATLRNLQIHAFGLDQVVEGDVDRMRLQQAVRNVLSNAIRYSPAGGSVELTLSSDGHSAIMLDVRDHGLGIPEDELETIFEAFVQSSRTRDGSGGTGLGLTIARKIMSAHGGSIVASNAEGGGSLIRLSLPAAGVLAKQAASLSWQDADGLLFDAEVS